MSTAQPTPLAVNSLPLRNMQSSTLIKVPVSREQRDIAFATASIRRTMAKLNNQQSGERNYRSASEAPTSTYEKARLCADRRAMLAELVIHDMLLATGVEFHMQPPVSYTPEHEADVLIGDAAFDVKAASDFSQDWSPAGPSGRSWGDKYITVNRQDHAHYMRKPGFAGYFGVYFNTDEEGLPTAATVFFVTPDDMTAGGLQQPAAHCSFSCKDMSYYRYRIPSEALAA